jgi:Mn-dependent DtxR family transcriptional regulator
MAVSSNMVDTLFTLLESSIETIVGEIGHTQWEARLHIAPRTYKALEYRGYITIVDYGYAKAYRLTASGEKYLEKYHSEKYYELQSRDDT